MLDCREHSLLVVGMFDLLHFHNPLLVEHLYGIKPKIVFAANYEFVSTPDGLVAERCKRTKMYPAKAASSKGTLDDKVCQTISTLLLEHLLRLNDE